MTVAMPSCPGHEHRIDPDALPARFRLPVEAGSGDASVYLDRRGVVLKRRLSGVPLTLSLPHSAYDGVAVRLVCDDVGLSATVVLSHRDPALTVPLASGCTVEDAAEDWRRWCDLLHLPMLMVEADGKVTKVGHEISVPVGPPQPRRRTGLLTRRRPRFLVRRKPGSNGPHPVLPAWREIIART